jgi:hypothetical protein
LPLHELAVSPADISGAVLRLALNAAAPRPLATHRLAHPGGGALTLGILGASHVITAEHGGTPFSEQVSCIAPTSDDHLPRRADAPGYELTSSSTEHDEPSFRTLAAELRRYCADDAGWLGGTFPGDDAALTALSAEPDGSGWRWRTWHLYPSARGGTVVHTQSRWQP